MKSIKGKNVLVTGGGMGMGKIYVQRAVQDGAARVVVWDRDEHAMKEVAQEFGGGSTEILTYVVDVTDTDRIYALAEQIVNKIGPVDLLINNAGIVNADNFAEQSPDRIQALMQINGIAPMHVARAFLPAMQGLPEAHIVNVASGAGYMYAPRIIVYCASKWAALGWSLGLGSELGVTTPNVKVTTVTPGHIDTGMFEGAHFSLMPPVKPEVMVDAVWRGIKKDKAIVRKPLILSSMPILKALLGVRGWDFFASKSGLNDFMAGFTGGRKD